jgi:hypothetical protein
MSALGQEETFDKHLLIVRCAHKTGQRSNSLTTILLVAHPPSEKDLQSSARNSLNFCSWYPNGTQAQIHAQTNKHTNPKLTTISRS